MTYSAKKKIFAASNINKFFPGVHALRNVDFDLMQAEVHALVGENGAGKSTLARIIAAILRPDSGNMSLRDEPYRPAGRRDAEKLAVRMVMQELNLIPNLTVAENIFVEKLPARFGFVDYKKLNRNAKHIMKQVGLADVEPDTHVKSLGVGQQQMVEIAAGISRKCAILILDEPTASLTGPEIDLLFEQIRKLKNENVAIIYISHKIEEVIRIADRVTVLRDGMVIATRPTADLDAAQIIRMMVGRNLQADIRRTEPRTERLAMRVRGLTRGTRVRNVSFDLHAGEILGIAGLMGSGRTETVRAIFAADRPNAGKIYLDDADRPARIRSPRDAVKNGIALLTEDRRSQGLFLPLSVRMNISFTALKNIATLAWIDRSKERMIASRYVDALSIRCSSIEQKAAQLSGGNQQKVVIAKWIYKDQKIIIFDEPTRGIDVGAKFEIYRLLQDLAGKGKALIMVSSDLKELMTVCDRIMVMSAGRVAGFFDRDNWTEHQIIAAAFSRYAADDATERKSQ